MNELQLTEQEGGVRFAVRVQPRASRQEISGVVEGCLRLRLTAPPVEGAANEACRRLLSRYLDVAPTRVRIVGGLASRRKTVQVDGLAADEVRRRLQTCLAGRER